MSVNGNVNSKLIVKAQPKFKSFKSFEWGDYLRNTGEIPAPNVCFYHNNEPPVNEFEINQKLEIISPENSEFVHLATVVNFIGPRLQLRLDGCDNSNDIFELVDSDALNAIGNRKLRNKYFAAPLRFRKDAASYASFCKSILKNSVAAPESAFKKPPKPPSCNMFLPNMKLEAVDIKHPSNICPATISEVDRHLVTIHLDGWEDSNGYTCTYNSRNLFPIGWCKKTGYPLQYPGPKFDLRKCKTDNSIISLSPENADLSIPVEVKKEGTLLSQSTQQDVKEISGEGHDEVRRKPDENSIEHQNKVEVKPFPFKSTKAETKIGVPKANVESPKNVSAASNTILNISPANTIAPTHSFSSISRPANVPFVTKLISSTAFPLNVKNNKNCVTKSTNSIHLTPKNNNIGDQIKQQQLLQKQTQKLIPSQNNITVANSSLSNGGKGIKRPSMSMVVGEKKQTVALASKATCKVPLKSNSAPNVVQVKTAFPYIAQVSQTSALPAASTTNNVSMNKVSNSNNNIKVTIVNGKSKQPTVSKYATSFPSSKVVNNWSVDEVVEFLNLRLPEFSKYESQFRSHEIDGKAFLLLTNESIIKFMNIKLGYSLKICNIVDQIIEFTDV